METPKLTIDRIRKYLSEDKRFDGRKLGELREIVIETGISKKAEGSVRVRLGKTEVLVGVKLDVTVPYPDGQDEGVLMTTAELLPLSSERFEAGPPKIEAIELGRIIDRGVRESGFIDFKKLCIKEGEKVWIVYLDIYSINDDGNLLDASAIGALAALKNAKMPKYDSEKGKVIYGEWTNNKLPLVDEKMAINVTAHKIGNKIILDPCREEEDASETRVSMGIGLGKDGFMINSMQKGNYGTISIEELERILELAGSQAKDIKSKIDKVK